MHKKDILFLISLPADLKAGMKISYTEYISILRSIERIELRESISQSDLAIADKFPLVIIVAHNNVSEESLILENGTLLPWTSIISYLPVSCTNTIDIGACKAKLGEMSVADAIKEHCPNIRRVLSPKKVTKVEGRLMLYREMLPSIDHDKDYYEVYSSKVAELQNRIIQLREGRKNKTDTLQGTKLGTESSEDVKTTVYSPRRVVRGERFSIFIAMHFDADNGTLFIDQRNNDPRLEEEKPREHNVVLNNVHYGDELSIKISFEDANDKPTELIYVIDNNPQHVKIIDKIVPLEFRVFVDAEYPCKYFTAILEYIKDGHCLKKFDYHRYGFESENPQYYIDNERPQINLTGDKTWLSKRAETFKNRPKGHENNIDEKKDVIPYEVERCFKLLNSVKFRKQKYEELINLYYNGISANLALIEIVLFCHDQLYKPNSHKHFIKALVAWGILNVDEEQEIKIYNALADKFKRLVNNDRPITYKDWKSDVKNDKIVCEKMGATLGPTMPYFDKEKK